MSDAVEAKTPCEIGTLARMGLLITHSASWHHVHEGDAVLGGRFREVVVGEARLFLLCEIFEEEWQSTEQIRTNVTLDEWKVMPSYLHGIVVIDKILHVRMTRDGKHSVETSRRGVSIRKTTKPLKPNSLASITDQFKPRSTKRIHDAGCPEFSW